ncbi:accessory Sec system protein translocase subunit SecY2 [Enterococcus casseliflavus]|uniref:accessory Sec system protein translocase subunit SecY2 n=1 Tax=Enterococcus sp. 8E11_MSG4843 TaxID=1834190 RepID=UPI000B3E58E2|nr:accessory Sec system protein translocase subunit SecY2 [Enterococcus sp. 8E11_MSG4843]MBO1096496.1 accessory Sec system protein translocase subunit SecY2 [Enterococcus casseliflavus]MBO1142696.1 accessory Sec system protein translocase subunit SecY2 [Enterococcus casseliflavus]OUZ30020.1 accessory Sec system translocase SecY2 [Enterococcus sp. 8E11_MSG4843]
MKNQKELIRRIIASFFLLFIVEIGKHIQVPFFISEKIPEESTSLILKFLATSTGGNFTVPTLFSLGMGPYMTALIIWTTISMIDTESIGNLSTKRIGYIQRSLTLLFAILQSCALVLKFHSSMIDQKAIGGSIVLLFLGAVLLLTAGGLFVAWLADINIDKGIGGQSLFIVPGLLMNIPAMLISGQTESVHLSQNFLIGLVMVTLVFIYLTLFLYNAEYRINIERTGIDSRFNNSYIPIRLLPAGAMPFMFAVTVFSMPQLLLLNEKWGDTGFSNFITTYFSFNNVRGVFTYGLILYVLGYGFSFINVRPYDIAKNLKETGDYILNVAPGKQTERYILKRLSTVALLGNSYLVIVSMIPLLIGLQNQIISNLAFYFGSIFMLIIILETITNEIRFLFSRHTYRIF